MTKKSMSNNCRNEGFGMKGLEDDLSRVSAESVEVFILSSRVFAQSSDFLT
jgi:hypothetical protein